MLGEDRRRKILSLLEHNKSVKLRELSELLKVTEMTVRRDLEKLVAEGYCRRIHGGAIVADLPFAALPFEVRDEEMAAEKDGIGNKAAEMVSDGQTVFIDASTTALRAGRALKNRNVTIITNSLNLQLELARGEGATVISTGGHVHKKVGSLIGPVAVEAVRRLHADFCFFSADAIDGEHGVTDTEIEEAAVKTAMIESARAVVLLADHTKFSRTAFARVCSIDAVDICISDTTTHLPGVKMIVVS